ncbi:MAG: MOFRL family protein, partial [Myxococcota bacterium]
LVSVVLSDVGGGPEVVGSGPTLSRRVPLGDALRDYELDRRLPSHVLAAVIGSHSPRRRTHPVITLAEPSHLVAAAHRTLEQEGFKVIHAKDRPESPTLESHAKTLLKAACSLQPGEAWVEACEPVVKLPDSPGRGGRNGHLALTLAREFSTLNGVMALIAGSDGVDGTSSIAGAAVDTNTWHSLHEPEDSLRAFDTGSLLERFPSGVQVLSPGPTGVNLRDLHLLARA